MLCLIYIEVTHLQNIFIFSEYLKISQNPPECIKIVHRSLPEQRWVLFYAICYKEILGV